MSSFTDAFVRLRHQFDEAREGRRQLVRQIQTEGREKAAQLAATLAEQSQNRRTQFAAWLGSLQAEVKHQAEATRGCLANLAADLHRGGSIFQGRGKRRSGK
jgi:hypothetical protein